MTRASVPKPAALKRGRFITLEGGEGAGKSTQARLIVERLESLGLEAVATREPGGTPHAEALRHVLLSGAAAMLGPAAEALLFSAARIDHLDRLIRPALARGTWVVCDRFSDSTSAYQGALGNLDQRLIEALERVTLGETRPDLTLILDLPPELGLARAAARRTAGAPTDRFEAEALAFHQGLRIAFRNIAARDTRRCVLIDASGGKHDVAKALWEVIAARLLTARLRAKARSHLLSILPVAEPFR